MHQTLTAAIRAALLAGQKILEIYKQPDFDIQEKEDQSPITAADFAANSIIEESLRADSPFPILSEETAPTPYAERKKNKHLWLVDPLDGTKEFIKKNDEFAVNIALLEGQKPILGVIYQPVFKKLYFAEESLGAYRKENITQEDFPAGKKIHSLIEDSEKLPLQEKRVIPFIVCSRSHTTGELHNYIAGLRAKNANLAICKLGASLKQCAIAEGTADLYPLIGKTMEWDTAAGDAIIRICGGSLRTFDGKPLKYNKENLQNPHFFACSKDCRIKI